MEAIVDFDRETVRIPVQIRLKLDKLDSSI